MINLDSYDRKILFELDRDARQPLSKIAKKVRLGSDLVDYRVQRLLKRKLISRFTPLINPLACGVNLYKTYIQHRFGEEELTDFIRLLKKTPSTWWVAEGHGRMDLLFSLALPNVQEFQKQQDKILSKYGQLIIDLDVYTIVETIRFPKGYLLEKSPKAIPWIKTPPKKPLDKLEASLLQAMAENSRIPISTLSDKLNSTPAIISYRLARLEKEGFILGHRVQLDYTEMQMLFFKVMIELRNFSPKIRKDLLAFCQAKPNITCFVQQIGAVQVEIEVEVGNYSEFDEVISDIRRTFQASVGRVEHMLIKKDHYHRIPSLGPSK